MNKTILYLGLNDKETKTQLISTGDAFELVAGVLADYVDGATISQAKGVYTHENGEQVVENSLRVELFQAIDSQVLQACQELKKALNQESIGIEQIESNTQFI